MSGPLDLGPVHVDVVRQVLAFHPNADLFDLAALVAEVCGLPDLPVELLRRFLVEHGLRERQALRLVRPEAPRQPLAISVRHASIFALAASEAPVLAILGPAPDQAPQGDKKGRGSLPRLQKHHLPTVAAIVDRNPALPMPALASLVAQACGFTGLSGPVLAIFLRKHGLTTANQRHCSERRRRALFGLRVAVASPTPGAPVASVFHLADHLALKRAKP